MKKHLFLIGAFVCSLSSVFASTKTLVKTAFKATTEKTFQVQINTSLDIFDALIGSPATSGAAISYKINSLFTVGGSFSSRKASFTFEDAADQKIDTDVNWGTQQAFVRMIPFDGAFYTQLGIAIHNPNEMLDYLG